MTRYVLLLVVLVASACSGSSEVEPTASAPRAAAVDGGAASVEQPTDETTAAAPVDEEATRDAPAPIDPLPEGADRAVERAIDDVVAFIGESTNPVDPEVFAALGAYDDIRLAWILADLAQFVFRGEAFDALLATSNGLTGEAYTQRTLWKGMSDRLIAEDVPAPPGYLDWKAELLTAVDVTWTHFFADEDAAVDWRLITFGGVLADTRPLGSEGSCACIPGLDDPPAVPAADGDWYPGHRPVFGIEIDGQARAYPLNIMEAHELVNDELAGRRFSLTYCTLCRSAVAFFTDDLPPSIDAPVLRTSGLLRRSNKVVFDRETLSMIDQFTGVALSGPLQDARVELTRLTVVTSTWDDWRAAHPETTFMAGKNGNGPNYPLDPLGDRDAGGPIFPIGDVDGTLFASQAVVGTILDDGSTVAFPLDLIADPLEAGATIEFEGVQVVADGSGFRLVGSNGEDLASSQASWFAWSQTFPDTALWQP